MTNVQILSLENYFLGQRILLALSPEEEEAVRDTLNIKSQLVSGDDLGSTKPSLHWSGNCGDPVDILDYSHAQYDFDPVDADALDAARCLKAKFKLEEYVRSTLCLEPAEPRQCKDINQVLTGIAFI